VTKAIRKMLDHKEIKYVWVSRDPASEILGRRVLRRVRFFFMPEFVIPKDFEELAQYNK